ncbi:MAG: ATP-dependent Clp protease ATP-binding subunit [Candidatus Kerfeldbacteria bacterium]|nr:ATP-dependent Clp protease ATP-binding subunit [Candidatus Kerfeldbacteria bacterium]
MSYDFLDKFTTHLKNVIKEAAQLAAELRHGELKPEHLLFGLTKQKGSISTEILVKAGLTPESLKDIVIQKNVTIATVANPLRRPEPALSEGAKRVIERAILIANQHEHKYVGTEHLLSSLLKFDDETVDEALRAHRLTRADLQQHLVIVLKNTSKFPDLTNLFEQTNGIEDDMPMPQIQPRTRDQRGSALDFFCTDLTDERLQESIDPVIGRQSEIERLIHILSRRTKNNPVLIGEPGVGKTAIVEGLAKRIVLGTVPPVLATKRIVSLDLSLVVAGTVYRGEFESRLKQIMEEVKQNTNIILFIDELHTLIGAGGASGALDAANILKPALAKGYLRCIGATTLDEFHKHIESDPALERRFQPIMIQEPTAEQTVEILRGIKENYERYHQVGISEGAVRAAVDLSIRYLQDKLLPDKAIDLIDEAAAKMKILKKTDGTAQEIDRLEDRLHELRHLKQQAVNEERFDDAMQVKVEEGTVMEKLGVLRDKQARGNKRLVGRITEKEVADVVGRMTGVPIGDILEQEQKKLLRLEQELKKRIVGQDDAVAIIAACIRRSRTGLSAPNRPLGSFIFLGPSGVGKTETAKVLAETVFGDANALLRFDMSEFSESFQASKLIGAPAGYVGYKEGGKLTESVKRRPYSVLLFDEIEKAHPDIFNLLLQILDEGHLTDAVGKKINFKNTIVILTSNIGMRELNRQAMIGFDEKDVSATREREYAQLQERVTGVLRQQFRPEFLNRIDKVLVFRPLTAQHAAAIVDLQLAMLRARVKEQDITLVFEAAIKKHLVAKGITPDQGARGLRRVLQDEVENSLAEHLLATPKTADRTIRVGFRAGRVTFK